MTRAFDLSKYRKSVDKNIDGVSTGFNDPQMWLHSGNYALNYLLANNFYKGIPLSKVCMFAGEQGSGKSLLCMGGIAKNAQDHGAVVVVLDSENALDENWLRNAGLDTSEDKLLRIGVTYVDDVASTIQKFMELYKEENKNVVDPSEAPPVLFVVDSLGMLLTPTEADQFAQGNMKGDMGRKAKALKALIQRCVNMFAKWPIGMVATNHVYASQDMFDPEDKIAGGSGFMYASSMVATMKKAKLKGENKSDVKGIRARVKIMKSRYAKPFDSIEIKIPYDKGIDEYSGLLELFENTGVLVNEGRKLRYDFSNGTDSMKEYRNRWTNEMLDQVLEDLKNKDLDKIVDENLPKTDDGEEYDPETGELLTEEDDTQ